MTKWSFFFLLVPIFGVASFAVAPMYGWWLPVNISTFGHQIDALYVIILWITGIVFIGTQLALFYILYQYSKREGAKATYSHGDQKLEVIWTIVPSVVLLFIALAQLPAWIEIRFPREQPDVPYHARVIGRQFEWRIIYPGPDGQLDTVDDIHVPNELHIAKGHDVKIDLRSMDVLHSFYMPHTRLKYDAVPGLSIPCWFKTEISSLEYQNEGAAFTGDDFSDLGAMLLGLRAGETPLAKHVFASLSEPTRQMIQDYDPEFYPTPSERSAFLTDLNAFIEVADLAPMHAEGKLGELTLSRDTQDHAKLGGAAYVRLLNRQVLQDAYPKLINPLRRDFEIVCAELCGWGHYKMRGRLVVHESRQDLQDWLDRAFAEGEAAK